jgi:hypothetical protein
VALAAKDARAASASPAAKPTARRRPRGCCFFLGEDRLKRWGVPAPGVFIGDGSPVAGGRRRVVAWGFELTLSLEGKERLGLQDFMNVNSDCGAAQLTPPGLRWSTLKKKKKIRISHTFFTTVLFMLYSISQDSLYLCFILYSLVLSSRYTNCQFTKKTDCQRRTKLIFSAVDVETTLICTSSFHVSLYGD